MSATLHLAVDGRAGRLELRSNLQSKKHKSPSFEDCKCFVAQKELELHICVF
jgi:hypothetical protein